MRKLTQPVTADELFEMSADGVRRELVCGDVREMPPAGGEHGATTSRLHGRISWFVDQRALGFVFAAETGFVISRNPDTVRAPDCAFVRAESLRSGVPEKYVDVIPDLVVETVSPGDRRTTVAEKTAEWLAAGVRLVWIVDPSERTVTVHSPDRRSPRTLTSGQVLTGEGALPGFRLSVDEIWIPRQASDSST